mgnify:CR=1 FL=1
MANLEELAWTVRNDGYSEVNAGAKVCQDIVLKAISNSSLNRNVTIKGGVVMRSITGSTRRATQDKDLDFIRYSLSNEAIRTFIEKLNCLDGITIRIDGEITELSQQEYNGKRVLVTIEDDVGASLLINSKEQIFTEKLKSLLRFGPLSTRYKDIFDLCYLSDHVKSDKLMKCIDTYIFSDSSMKENNITAIRKRVERTFSDKLYHQNIERSVRFNWLGIKIDEAFSKITSFLETL